jgi:TATA-box binding protein (TBP) (component of TFIID and TFIIIB)
METIENVEIASASYPGAGSSVEMPSSLLTKDEQQPITISNSKKQKMIHIIDNEQLPEDVTISTITATCSIDTEFIVGNIGKYIDLKHSSIISVKHGNSEDPATNRTLIKKKKTGQKKKKQKKAFYNQVSVKIRVKDFIVDIKLFLNGSIQMTGCKSINGAYDALEKLFSELKTIKAIADFKEKKIIEKPFANDLSKLDIDKINNFKIGMINSNFNIGFKIDRDKLYNILIVEGQNCTYDPIIHACVNIKYNHPDKIISIFVFESGAVIITGARNCGQILDAHNFIGRYLLEKYKFIVKNDILTNSTILKFLTM